MCRPARSRGPDQGFTLIELMVVVVIISLATAAALPVYQDAIRKSQRRALVADCGKLYDSLMAYYVDEDQFPSEWGPGAFDRETLAPLSTEGYFPIAKAFTGKLDRERIMIYLAPDIGTPNSQYIAVMRSGIDPSVIAVVAHTEIIDAADHFLDGVYLITDGDLEEADELD